MSADRAACCASRLRRIERLGPSLCVLWLHLPGLGVAEPGQFLHVRVGNGYLRRPFSVYRQQGEEVALLIQIRGRGTRWLAALEPGATVDVLGPLGRAFAPPTPGARTLLVGGGIGVAPLVHFAETHATRGSLEAVFGFRAASGVVGDARLASLGVPVTVYTEDGSVGLAGRVTTGLAERLRDTPPDRVLVCGPEAMMQAVAALCEAAGVLSEVLLERPMGCGFGVCLLCVVPVRTAGESPTYERVCCEGPMFDSRRLAW